MLSSYVDVSGCLIILSRIISFNKLTSAKILIHQFPERKHKLIKNVQFSYESTCLYGYTFVIQLLLVKIFPNILRMNYGNTTNTTNDGSVCFYFLLG